MELKCINLKHQVTFKRAINWLIKYNKYSDQRDHISGHLECEEYESKEWRAINRKCESSYDKFETYMDELPKREQKVILKSNLY